VPHVCSSLTSGEVTTVTWTPRSHFHADRTRSTKHISINVTIKSNFTILPETVFSSLLSIVNNKSETQAPINTINKKTHTSKENSVKVNGEEKIAHVHVFGMNLGGLDAHWDPELCISIQKHLYYFQF
jgi:hypothetical protein